MVPPFFVNLVVRVHGFVGFMEFVEFVVFVESIGLTRETQ